MSTDANICIGSDSETAKQLDVSFAVVYPRRQQEVNSGSSPFSSLSKFSDSITVRSAAVLVS